MSLQCYPRFRKSLRALVFPLAPVLLAGCYSFAPRPIVQYRNLDPDPVFFRGTQSHVYEGGGLKFGVAVRDFSWEPVPYRRSRVFPLTFQVEIRNLGPASILIDPADFTLSALPRDSAQELIDPEIVLYTSQAEIERHKAMMTSEMANQAVIGVLDLAGEIASLADARQERERLSKENEEHRRDREERLRAMESELTKLEARKAHWTDVPVRKTTLAPGMKLEGTVAFSLNPPFPQTLVLRFHGDSTEANGFVLPLGHYRLQPPPD